MKYLKVFEEKDWISKAIKNPGSLRRSLGKKKGEKISKSKIESEISDLRKKDKDLNKKGIQGLGKRDSRKYKRLNLAKTLIDMNESIDIITKYYPELMSYYSPNMGNFVFTKEELDINFPVVIKSLESNSNWALICENGSFILTSKFLI